MHKSIRSKKIPAMVAVTITGEDEAMYKALSKAIQQENRKRIARGEEPVPYIINHMSTSRPSMSLKDNATVNLPRQEIGMAEPVDKSTNTWDKNTVMGINPKLFEGTVGVLHDFTEHFQGERYTIAIDVEPEWVRVRKIAKESD